MKYRIRHWLMETTLGLLFGFLILVVIVENL